MLISSSGRAKKDNLWIIGSRKRFLLFLSLSHFISLFIVIIVIVVPDTGNGTILGPYPCFILISSHAVSFLSHLHSFSFVLFAPFLLFTGDETQNK